MREKRKSSQSATFFLSGKRDSNSRPQPWQGCALPTELFPQLCNLICVPRTGLEPARLSPLAPETSASTIPPPGPLSKAFLMLFRRIATAKVVLFRKLTKLFRRFFQFPKKKVCFYHKKHASFPHKAHKKLILKIFEGSKWLPFFKIGQI